MGTLLVEVLCIMGAIALAFGLIGLTMEVLVRIAERTGIPNLLLGLVAFGLICLGIAAVVRSCKPPLGPHQTATQEE